MTGWQGKPIGDICDAAPVTPPSEHAYTYRDSARRRYAIDECHCDAWKFAPHIDEGCPLHVPLLPRPSLRRASDR